MSAIEIRNEEFYVDAALIAEGFGLDPASVPTFMRDGRITSRCERGVDEDAGRFRLTFFTERRCMRLLVDEAGNLLDKAVFALRRSRAVRP
jgi:hypothetical protein